MRRRDQANVDVDGLIAAQSLELLLLQCAQQLRLQLWADVPDFVEKQSAMIGKLEPSTLLHQGARERALFVSEEFAFDQPGWNGRAIEPYKRPVSSWTVAMNCACNQLFPSARLAAQQNSRSRGGDNLDLVEDFAESGALAHEILEVVFRADFRFEIQALVFQPIPRCAQSSVRERVVERQGNLRADLGQDIEVLLSKLVRPLAAHGNEPKRSVRGPQGSVCQCNDRFSLQPFENRRWKLLDLLLRSDRRRSSAHPLQVVIGEFSGNIGKKALAAREIETHTFQLIGVFIDEPETGEVIRKVFANRR